MKTKQILLLIVLVVVVGIGGLVLQRKQGAAWNGGAAEGEKLLANLPVGESLAQVVIQQGTNTLTLAKQDDVWGVKERGGYPANYNEISSTILKLRDLKPVQTEQVGPSQLGRLELLPPDAASNAATRVEFRDAAGKSLASLSLGKTQMREDARAAQFGGGMGGYPAGRWVMLGDSKDTVYLVADPLSSLKTDAGQWLNKDFIKVEKIKSIRVTHPEPTNSWTVSRANETGSDWTLADAKEGETLDSIKSSGFGYALGSPSFNDVASEADATKHGLNTPVAIVIETFDGFTYTLKAGAKTDDNQTLAVNVSANLPKERTPAEDETPDDKARLDQEFADQHKKLLEKLAKEKAFEKWTYFVPGYTLDSLLKNRGELLANKEETADADSTVEEPDFLDLPSP